LFSNSALYIYFVMYMFLFWYVYFWLPAALLGRAKGYMKDPKSAPPVVAVEDEAPTVERLFAGSSFDRRGRASLLALEEAATTSNVGGAQSGGLPPGSLPPGVPPPDGEKPGEYML
jgi:hypothetical protein